jgi:hypothetical protein
MARRVTVRAQRLTMTWDKGRRPRQHIRSRRAKAGVRSLRSLVFLISGLLATLMAVSFFQGLGLKERPERSSQAASVNARPTSTAASPSRAQSVSDPVNASAP